MLDGTVFEEQGSGLAGFKIEFEEHYISCLNKFSAADM